MLSQEHNFYMDMTVLERQEARLKWLQQQTNYVNQSNNSSIEPCSIQQFQDFFDHAAAAVNGDHVVDNWKRKPEMHLGSSSLINGSNNLLGNGSEFVANKTDFFQAEEGTSCLEIDHCLSRTSSCQKGSPDGPRMEKEVMVAEVAGEDAGLMDKVQQINGRDSKNKREAEFVATEDRKDKRTKRGAEIDSKVKEKTSTENSVDSSKDVPKKQDYIHVRARRGQATDSHSLAERARREKISKKMKCLQDLVPGCNKITGRAGMLDEIINYVQSLQRQVEFLSMKLAALTPRIESSTDNFSMKEFPAFAASYPTAIGQLPHLKVNLVQQEATGSEQEVLTTDGTTSSSAFMPTLDSTCFPVQSFWDTDMQNLHNVGFHQG